MNSIKELIGNVPRLNIRDRKGVTGYIDFINNSDMTNPIMIGYDYVGRQFISFKLAVYDKDMQYLTDVTGTIFERYSDSSNNLAYGTSYIINPDNMSEYHLWYDSRIRDYDMENLFKRINLLVAGETIKTIINGNISIHGSGNYYLKLSQ
jgi:hypothetical protein